MSDIDEFLKDVADVREKLQGYESWLETGKAGKYKEVPATIDSIRQQAIRLQELCNKMNDTEAIGRIRKDLERAELRMTRGNGAYTTIYQVLEINYKGVARVRVSPTGQETTILLTDKEITSLAMLCQSAA